MVNDSKPPLKAAKPKSKPKKAPVNKETANVPHRADTKAVHEASTSGAPVTPTVGAAVPKVASTGWFTSEIQSMMHGFGDYRRPLLESAQLIEEIVHQQMNSLLIQAADVATLRGVRIIGIEDILFLLRKDKVKLARLIRYLEMKDLKTTLMKNIGTDDEDVTDVAGTSEQKPTVSRPKFKKLALDFLSSIDQTGELTSSLEDDMFDDIKFERDMRAEQMTRCMDKQQYMEFCNARRASFARKYRTAKFRDWLLKDNLTDIKPNALALEIFHYMSYETVAQIVDLALLVKQDAKGQSGDRLQRVIPPNVYSPEYPGIQLLHQNRFSLFNSADASPQRTTPSPPHSPAVASNPRSSPGPAAASTASHGKPKPKKRKKVEGRVMTEIPTSQCIQPSDIREAIQRYWKQGGPYTLFSKVHCSNIRTRLLCT